MGGPGTGLRTFFVNFRKNKRNMATVTLEISDEQDLKLVLALAKRLNWHCYVETDEVVAYTVVGAPLTAEQLGKQLDEAAEAADGIPLEEFIQKMQSWK